nr:Chain I, 12-mer Peptide [synthetic construct]4J26_J Chain J, 12-mer Peptide [synthetic construct]
HPLLMRLLHHPS